MVQNQFRTNIQDRTGNIANIPIIWNRDRRDIIEEGLSSSSYSAWINTERELDITGTDTKLFMITTRDTSLAKRNIEQIIRGSLQSLFINFISWHKHLYY